MCGRMPPKQRQEGSGSKPRSRQRTDKASLDRRLLAVAAALGVVVIAAVLGWLLFGGGTEDAEAKARSALESAGCTLRVVPGVENAPDHSDVPNADFTSDEWNTDPPTSGPHFGETLIFGAYDEPVQFARVLHNLEHGGVFVAYGSDVPDSEAERLRAFYEDNSTGTILAPYPKLGNRIAMGAWVEPGLDSAKSDSGSGVLATCTTFDEDAFAAFLDAFQFKGPERFPQDSLLPGM